MTSADKVKLAVNGGVPVRAANLPYGRQTIDDRDIEAVLEVLRSDWLTTGPKVSEFEVAFAEFVGADEAVAVSSGTAALHAMMVAAGVGPGDEVIVPAITFAATANAVLYVGATPVFADVESSTILIDPVSVEKLVTDRTRAIVAVDYAGQPADYAALQAIVAGRKISIFSDACHAIGALDQDKPVGTLSRASSFSFHPVKHMTTAEGGMIVTGDKEMADRMRWFRNHGITTDHGQRAKMGTWSYDMVALGFNYRLSDLQCALGLSQLPRLGKWVQRRQEIAAAYEKAFAGLESVTPLSLRQGATNAYHLYVVQLELDTLSCDRNTIFDALRAEGIGVNVHYKPVYLHSYYRGLGYPIDLCPVSEHVFQRILSLPVFPTMNNQDVNDVVEAMKKVTTAFRK